MTRALPEIGFSEAKSGLSDVMTSVVHQHQPRLVQRHGGKESMLLVRPDDLVHWLSTFTFDLGVTLDEDDVTLEVRGLDVLGFGATFEEALEDAASELRLYAKRFFERTQFYRESDRAPHFPFLLRYALTPDDQQVALLQSDFEHSLGRERQEVLSSTA